MPSVLFRVVSARGDPTGSPPYAGVNTVRAGRLEELAMHPTVKPVALVADAIKDCSRRGGLVVGSKNSYEAPPVHAAS